MSCSSGSAEKNIVVGGDGQKKGIAELVKVYSLDEANKLLKEEHIFLAVYYNQAEAREEYILGRLEKAEKPERPIGFTAK